MNSNIKSYELFLIFSMNVREEKRDSLINRFCDIIKSNGQVDKVDKWGKRRLAYAIDKEPEGFYCVISFKSSSEIPGELTRIAGITDGVLRNLLVTSQSEN